MVFALITRRLCKSLCNLTDLNTSYENYNTFQITLQGLHRSNIHRFWGGAGPPKCGPLKPEKWTYEPHSLNPLQKPHVCPLYN